MNPQLLIGKPTNPGRKMLDCGPFAGFGGSASVAAGPAQTKPTTPLAAEDPLNKQ